MLSSLLSELALAAGLGLLLALGLRLIDVAAADLSVVGLFSTDEQLAGQLVRAMLEHGNLGLSHFYSYGSLDLYAARFLLWPWSLARAVSDEAIVVALRGVSLLAGLGCVALTFELGRRLWSATTGALAALALALSPTVLAWSTTAHPDTLQLLFLLLGLYWSVLVAARRSRWALLLGAGCAALAFATKYSGELVLPVLWLADLLSLLAARRPEASEAVAELIPTLLIDAALTVLVFLGCFLLVDPSALIEPRQFIYQASLEAGLAHSGHLYRLAAGGVAWLGTVLSMAALGPALSALGLAGLVAWTAADFPSAVPIGHSRAARPDAAAARGRLLLVVWVAGYLLFLLLWIADRQPRYALPILPGLALFAAAALVWLARRSRPAAVAAGLLAALALLSMAWASLQYTRGTAARLDNPLVQQRIAAGTWLAAHVAGDIPVVADAYAYLPPTFTNVDQTFGLTRAEIAAAHPRIIVTDAAIRDRFRNPADAARYVDGSAAYAEIAATYEALDAGQLACYPLWQRFGPESVYGQPPGDPAPAGC